MSPIISSFASGRSFGRRGPGGPPLPVFNNLAFNSYNFSGGVFSFNSPGEILLVDIYGAQGGTGSNDSGPIYGGGLGGRIQAYIQVTLGQTIYGLVGGQGGQGSGRGGGGGGGFSALWVGSADPGAGTWLIGAGGGGGSGARGDNGVTFFTDSGGGSFTATQANGRSGGSAGSGGNGGGSGGNGSTSGGGFGGSGGCDCSGGGGGGGSGQSGGGGNSQGGSGGFGGGGGAGNGGSGGWPYRVTSGGGGGGGWNGGNGGLHGAYDGVGGSNFYLSQTILGIATQLQTSQKGVRSGNGFIDIRY